MSQNSESVAGVAGDRLLAFVERIERLTEERQSIGQDIREVYAEAKAVGFDPKAIRAVIRARQKTAMERQVEQLTFETYWEALHGAEDSRTSMSAA